MSTLVDEIASLFEPGDTVRVTVGWLALPQDATGEVLGLGFHDPVTYLVRFPGGVYPVPAVHLERERASQQALRAGQAPAAPPDTGSPGVLAPHASQRSLVHVSVDESEVLTFIGQKGKSPEATSGRFPALDIFRLVRAGLVEVQRLDLTETQARGDEPPVFIRHYVLTPRGADAIGLSVMEGKGRETPPER